MDICYTSPVAKKCPARRVRTSSHSQSPLTAIGPIICRSPCLSTSIDSGYDSDNCPSRHSPPRLYTSDTLPNSVKLPPPPPLLGSAVQTAGSNRDDPTTPFQSASYPRTPGKRRRRRFRRSQSDMLLRTVLKRAQRNVNKLLVSGTRTAKSPSPPTIRQEQSPKSSVGVNPADYKDLKYVAPSSVAKLVDKSTTSGSPKFVLIDCRNPGRLSIRAHPGSDQSLQ